MYNWRKMTAKQRVNMLASRKAHKLPWHGPPHQMADRTLYHLSAANFEHKPIIGQSIDRMIEFEVELLATLSQASVEVLAWCVLSNHYHVLVKSTHILDTLKRLGQLHGRSSFRWNHADNRHGRQCWYRCTDRAMRTERHKWATLNYVHHNPVHHKYVRQWQDWPFSSALRYLEDIGYETAMKRWKSYPLLDYGKGWDDSEL